MKRKCVQLFLVGDDHAEVNAQLLRHSVKDGLVEIQHTDFDDLKGKESMTIVPVSQIKFIRIFDEN